MKVELSNQELKDIHECLGAVAVENLDHINVFRKTDDKEFKLIADKLEKDYEREMFLLNKVFKLIDWGNN
jgi:hypothetical protein